MEKYARQLDRGPLKDAALRVIETPRMTVELRPANKLIVVTRPFHETGFWLAADHQLSAPDRQSLARLIQDGAPEASPRSVAQSVAAEARRLVLEQRRLRGMDSSIDALLRKAAQASGTRDQVLWKSGKAELVYSPTRNVLLGFKGFSQQGFFLEQKGAALGLQSPEREALRAFLLQNGK